MADTEDYMNGIPITRLSNSVIADGDILLTSREVNKNREQFFSRGLDFETLLNDIKNGIITDMGFGTMSTHGEDEYSKVGHTHEQYNHVEYRPQSTVVDDGIVIGKIIIDDKIYELSIHNPLPQIHSPEIGQIKFMATTTGMNVDITSTDFDGWVLADGSSYSLDDFDVGEEVFDIDRETNTFTVPCIDDMIMINSRPYESYDCDACENLGIPKHNHEFNTRLSNGTVNGKFKYWCGQYGKGTSSHGSSTIKGTKTKNYAVKIKMTYGRVIDDPVVSPNELLLDQKPKPSTISVPVMIYIGRRCGNG